MIAADTCPAKLSDEVSACETVGSYMPSAISEENVTTGGVGGVASEPSVWENTSKLTSYSGPLDIHAEYVKFV